ncbi:hypothetical protein [Embleya sp. NBC_00896]|uniref:hypothetical protein n=1 Tax=Embleya sp. NBC_00896 TaxID=2975961 RepID=UPI00386F14B6|nr:hypothetical protein OG928_37565 [Embleya sp. NBC_00896]
MDRNTKRLAVAAAVLILVLAGCEDEDGAHAEPTTDSAATARAERANAAMAATTFHATGTSTAVSNATVETWYDPAQGLHSVVKRNFAVIGRIICRDGVSAMSRSLTSDNPALADDYIVSRLPGGCAQLFTIPLSVQAPLTSDGSGAVNGVRADAVKAVTEQETAVFRIAAEGRPYILRQESTRGHLTSHTEYGEFGRPVTIPPLPPK